jgi:enoyl-CoA hydratase
MTESTMPDTSQEFSVSIEAGILIMTINRPEARNAMTRSISEKMAAALDELDARADLRVAIVTGAGGTFCSGMDLKGFLRGERPSIPGRGFGGLTMKPPAKPIIAAVEGYALAGGFELALACDFIIASDSAKFGIPEAKRGLAASAGGLIRLPRLIPTRIALEFALTGDMVSAERAYQLGLINRITAQGQALEGAKTFAQSIMANGPLAIAASKRVVYESRLWEEHDMWKRQEEITASVFDSDDAREGAAAFAQKRKPNWTGK